MDQTLEMTHAALALADLEALLPETPPPAPKSEPMPGPIAASAVLWQHVPLLPGLELRIYDPVVGGTIYVDLAG